VLAGLVVLAGFGSATGQCNRAVQRRAVTEKLNRVTDAIHPLGYSGFFRVAIINLYRSYIY
jgi:hypothetical protein